MAILFYPTIQTFGGRGVRIEPAHVVIGHGVRTVLAVVSNGELELCVARAHLYQVEIDAATVVIAISFKIHHPIHPMQFLQTESRAHASAPLVPIPVQHVVHVLEKRSQSSADEVIAGIGRLERGTRAPMGGDASVGTTSGSGHGT